MDVPKPCIHMYIYIYLYICTDVEFQRQIASTVVPNWCSCLAPVKSYIYDKLCHIRLLYRKGHIYGLPIWKQNKVTTDYVHTESIGNHLIAHVWSLIASMPLKDP